jgi:hypothetical protein
MSVTSIIVCVDEDAKPWIVAEHNPGNASSNPAISKKVGAVKPTRMKSHRERLVSRIRESEMSTLKHSRLIGTSFSPGPHHHSFKNDLSSSRAVSGLTMFWERLWQVPEPIEMRHLDGFSSEPMEVVPIVRVECRHSIHISDSGRNSEG